MMQLSAMGRTGPEEFKLGQQFPKYKSEDNFAKEHKNNFAKEHYLRA